ncbi:alpha/beta hydrolase [Massilia sp. H6]|uniref:alpha/beta hydrolase n=1 Tax=Massilia sp. H6 TaxID=2970464 RepID=UPI002169657D|nr:alpha/beta hydrolase-fold protein [Massilia sp. H6]UVW28060.1 alpha/beta hydrolase-fold protein [Massilia sp. H6]
MPLPHRPALALALTIMLGVPAMTAIAADAASAAARASTALPGVSLFAPLEMPGLDRKRQVRLYLPPGYAASGKRYPVLYMHDGQNLFDNATAYAGEWGVDETLDALARQGKLELIVVGIDNGGDKRMTELNAWNSERFGAAEGREYLDFIVKTLKPQIDQRYRTLPGREHTAIMGSSMGGLASHYALAQYPEVFSKAGVFSPAYWTAQPVFGFMAGKPLPKDARVFMLMGEKEGPQMVADVQRMADVVAKSGHPAASTVLKIVPGAQHNETFWASELREALLWMFAPETTPATGSQ